MDDTLEISKNREVGLVRTLRKKIGQLTSTGDIF